MTTKTLHSIHKFIRSSLVAVALTIGMSVQAQTPESVDSLKEALANATTPADSVSI